MRWLCLAVILADIALLALQAWWLARFPDDDVPFDADAADPRDASPWAALPLGITRYASALWANGGAKGGEQEGRGRDALLWQWALRAAPLAAVFCAQVGVVIALAIITAREPLPAQPCADGAAFVARCQQHGLLLRPARRGLLIVHVCLTAAYAFLFVAYLYLASRALRGQPYDRSRRRRIALRFLLWSSSKALLTAVAAVAISLLVGIDSCETRALADYGFAPLQIVLAVYTAAHAYCLAPAVAGEERGRHVLLEQLQLFAWREEEVPGVAALRNADTPKAAWAEPVFCVETACKLFSWSWAAYECGKLAGGADLRAGGGDQASPTLLVRPLGPRLRDAGDSGAPLPGDVPLAAEVAALQRRRRSRWHRLRMSIAAFMPRWEKEARAAEAAAQSGNGGGSSWPGWDPRAMAAHASAQASSWGRRWMPQRRPHDEETADDAASSGDESDADADAAAHAADEAHAGGASGADAAAVADTALVTVVMSRRAARRARARVLLPRLLSLYGQRGAWVFSESRRDTRALLAWGPDAIVLAFRGSASAENFRTDAALALVTHPPRRRVRLPRSVSAPLRSHTPAVHSGFWRAYTAGGLRAALLAKLGVLTSAAAASGAPLRLLCTGHSLGGALATLAAFDAAAACGLPRDAITVVTFGAPRVGNHAFAADLDAAVPSTWNVVLGRDAVFRGAKLGGAYKHPGKRVALKREGTLLVRPHFVESSFSRGGGALGDHLLRRYEAALETLARRADAPEHADALRACLLYADGNLPQPEAHEARPPETATPPAHAALE